MKIENVLIALALMMTTVTAAIMGTNDATSNKYPLITVLGGNGDAATTIIVGTPRKDGDMNLTVKPIGNDAKKLTEFSAPTTGIRKTDTADAKALKIRDIIQNKINLDPAAAGKMKCEVVANVVVISSLSPEVKVIRIDAGDDGTGQDMKITEKPDTGKADPVPSSPPSAGGGGSNAHDPMRHWILFYLTTEPSGVALEGSVSYMEIGINGRVYREEVDPGETREHVYRALMHTLRDAGETVYIGPDGVLILSRDVIEEFDVACLDATANIGWRRS